MRKRIHSASAAFLFLVSIVTVTSAFDFPNRSRNLSTQSATVKAASSAQHPTTLTLADRVAYQRGIDEGYWRHRLWPKERPEHKPSPDEVLSQAQSGGDVERGL